MTKEELAKKKGVKLIKRPQSPSVALVSDNKCIGDINSADTFKMPTRASMPSSDEDEISMSIENNQNKKITKVKKRPGKPKTRKEGDRKISFWLDADLVKGLYDNLTYGTSAGQVINDAVREYQKKHKTYVKKN